MRTVKQLIVELLKCPDQNAEVRYRNVEIGDDRAIDKVIVKHDAHIVVGSPYLVVLD